MAVKITPQKRKKPKKLKLLSAIVSLPKSFISKNKGRRKLSMPAMPSIPSVTILVK